nr:MAG TPA: hypothetical protein [Caudoviricetes sp.]
MNNRGKHLQRRRGTDRRKGPREQRSRRRLP